jgi:hypothetical protein
MGRQRFMQSLSAAPSHPVCHLAHIQGPGGQTAVATAVWICEYPYRTIRLSGPSPECGDCPVWQEMARVQGQALAAAAIAQAREQIKELESLMY